MELTGLRIDLAGHYARNGYLVGPLLSPTQAMRLVDTSWCYLRSRGVVPSDQTCTRTRTHASIRSGTGPGGGPGSSDGAEPVTFDGIADQLPAAAEVALRADTLLLAAELLRAPSVRLVRSSLLYQPPHSAARPPEVTPENDHRALTPALRPTLQPDLTAVIAIDDQFDDGGGLRIIPGSHHDLPQETPHSTAKSPNHGAEHGDEYSVVLPIGWVAMLDNRLRYSRTDNASDLPRRSLILQYTARGSGGRG
jgi:hypothetical protein